MLGTGDPLLAFGVLLPLGAMLVPCQRLDVVMSPRTLSASQGWSISPGRILLRFLPSARPVALINPLTATPSMVLSQMQHSLRTWGILLVPQFPRAGGHGAVSHSCPLPLQLPPLTTGTCRRRWASRRARSRCCCGQRRAGGRPSGRQGAAGG